MAAAETGKYRARHNGQLFREAKRLRDSGLTMKEIARVMSKAHPELALWSRGLVSVKPNPAAVARRKDEQRRARAKALSPYQASDEELRAGLRDVAGRLARVNASQRRRLVRLVREIGRKLPRETRRERNARDNALRRAR